MRRRIFTGLFIFAGAVWACGDQLPDSNDPANQADGGDASSLADGGAPIDDATSADGTSSDASVDEAGEAGPCFSPPGFCEGFETDAVFTPWAKSEGSGGAVAITNTSPHVGIGALSGTASGGSGQAIAAVTKVIAGDFKAFECTMWLRAPNGWNGSYDVLSIGTSGALGFQNWRASLGVATNKARVTSDTTTDAGTNVPASNVGGAIESTPSGGWVYARLAFSNANGWMISGTIGASTTTAQAPNPTALHDVQFFVGLSRAAYASTPPSGGFALDVDDLRCTIAK